MKFGCTKRELRAAEMTSKMKPNVVSWRSEKRRGESQSRLPPSISPTLLTFYFNQDGPTSKRWNRCWFSRFTPSESIFNDRLQKRASFSISIFLFHSFPFSHDSYQTSDLNSHRNWNISLHPLVN